MPPTGDVAPCPCPAWQREALMSGPSVLRAAGGMTRRTSGVLLKHQMTIAVALSLYCSYLNIFKPNHCWGHRSLKPSNESFFPVQRKGLIQKGWKRKLSSILQRSSHLKLCQVQVGPGPPFRGLAGMMSSEESEVNRLLSFMQGEARLLLSVNTDSEVSRRVH